MKQRIGLWSSSWRFQTLLKEEQGTQPSHPACKEYPRVQKT